MYKRLFWLAVFVFSLYSAFAQLSVSLHEPPAGIVQKTQLWNITMIYSGNALINVTIGLSLFDIRDNQPLMTAYTKSITLSKGVKQLRASDVGPVEYSYFSSAFDLSRLPDAFLPIGNYRACYTVYTGSKNTEGVLSEDCINLEIQPLSPPQLNLPSDSGMIETPYPQFNWLPPTPIILFSDLNYDLLVTEIQTGQTPEEAIQENLPVYNVNHLTSVVHNYPSSNKSLDTGKIYAWRIVAKNGETLAAQSEIWTFSVASKKTQPLVPANGTYLELKREESYTSTGIIPNNILGIKYYSYDKGHNALIRFLNEKGEVVKEITKTIQYGNNFIVFKLNHSFKEEITYFIEITDLQMSRYRTSFRISKSY
jgi:hypothetical protein